MTLTGSAPVSPDIIELIASIDKINLKAHVLIPLSTDEQLRMTCKLEEITRDCVLFRLYNAYRKGGRD